MRIVFFFILLKAATLCKFVTINTLDNLHISDYERIKSRVVQVDEGMKGWVGESSEVSSKSWSVTSVIISEQLKRERKNTRFYLIYLSWLSSFKSSFWTFCFFRWVPWSRNLIPKLGFETWTKSLMLFQMTVHRISLDVCLLIKIKLKRWILRWWTATYIILKLTLAVFEIE